MKQKGFFVTGTDTDIGKTYISKVLADTFSCMYPAVTYMKPVQTGCIESSDGNLIAPDFDYVMSGRAVMTGTYDQHVPYRFKPACSPHLGASLVSREIALKQIYNCFFEISKNDTLIIVEGAGGILVPLSKTCNTIDLINHLQLPVILVTSPRIGTLNHTFLTLNELHRSGVVTAGVVFNNLHNDPVDYIYNDNSRMIREYIHPVAFLEVNHGIIPRRAGYPVLQTAPRAALSIYGCPLHVTRIL